MDKTIAELSVIESPEPTACEATGQQAKKDPGICAGVSDMPVRWDYGERRSSA
jgi:hypothetical protein